MKQMTKLRSGRDSRLIWQGIVDYANADLAGDPKASKDVEALVRACLPGLMSTDSLVEFAEIGQQRKRTDETLDEIFAQKARCHQSSIRKLLRWLCRPNEQALIPIEELFGRPATMVHPVDFLNSELEGASGQLKKVDPSFDEDSNHFFPFYFERAVKFGSIIGPICKFIVDELEDSAAMAPIRICEREGCGKFTMPERQGRKRFCSDQCRALTYQGSRDDWNEYMRAYRKIKSQRKQRTRGK